MKLRNIIASALAFALSSSPAFAQDSQGTSPLSIAKGGTGNASLPWFLSPPAGLTKIFNTTQTLTGTTSVNCVTTGGLIAQFPCVNLFNISADGVNATAPSNALDGWQFNHTFGGSTLTGARQSLDVIGNFTAPSSASNGNRNYVPLVGQMNVLSGDGGTGLTIPTAKGSFFGGNLVVRGSGAATNLGSATGLEVDLNMAGSQVVRGGFSAVSFPSTQGALYDYAYSVGAASGSGSIGWKTGLLFNTGINGYAPIDVAGCMICTDSTPATVATGIDFSAYTITGNFLAAPNGNFTVSGAGVASVSDGTARAIWGGSSLFTHSAQIGTSTNHNFVFLTNNTLAGYFDTSQRLNLGVNGISAGSLVMNGLTSGSVRQAVPAAAGSAVITWGSATGTPAVTASSPLAISTTTGNVGCATCVTSSGGGAITGTAPISVSAAGVVSITSPLPVANGGTNYTGGAWTAYTATVTPTSGAITTQSSSSAFLQIGKFVAVRIQVTVSNIGTGLGPISIGLPVASNGPTGLFCAGRESGVSGKMQSGIMSSGSLNMSILNYDNTAPTFSNGVIYNFNCTYESN